jgi:hypothetical protein
MSLENNIHEFLIMNSMSFISNAFIFLLKFLANHRKQPVVSAHYQN